jgi:hypothetical protein
MEPGFFDAKPVPFHYLPDLQIKKPLLHKPIVHFRTKNCPVTDNRIRDITPTSASLSGLIKNKELWNIPSAWVIICSCSPGKPGWHIVIGYGLMIRKFILMQGRKSWFFFKGCLGYV